MGIVLVSSLVLAYFVHTLTVGILESQIEDKLEEHAFHVMDAVDRMFFERYEDIKELAGDPVISSRVSTPKQISERLTAYLNNHRFYASLSLFDLNRIWIADTSGKFTGKQHAFTEYWPDITRGKDFVMVVTESQALENKIVFYFAAIVKDKSGKPFGVVVSRMPVEKLQEITSQAADVHHVGEKLKISLVDRDGLLLYSNYLKGILKEISPDWEAVKGFLATGMKVGSSRHQFSGEDEISTFAREQGYLDYKGNDWTLIICMPAHAAFAPARELGKRMGTILFIIGIFVLLIVIIFSRTISKPVEKLSAAAIEIGKGNLDVTVDVASKDEIGRLARAFNKMAVDLKKDIVVRKKAAEALKKERDTAQMYLDIAGVMLAVLDVNGVVALMNRRGCKILGYREEEIVGKDWFDHFLPEWIKDQVKGVFRQIMAGNVKPLEYYENPVLTKNREERTIAFHNSIMTDQAGNIVGVIFSGEDITERRKAEEARQAIEDKLNIVADGLPVLLSYTDTKQRYRFANNQYEKWFGFSPAEMIGKTVREVLGDARYEKVKGQIELVLSGQTIVYEDRMPLKDGRVIDYEIKYVPHKNAKGEVVGYVVMVQNITDRKHAEDALRETTQRLQLATTSGRLGIWDWDVQADLMIWDDRMFDLYGVKREAFPKCVEAWKNRLHPDDRSRTIAEFEAALRGEKEFDTEFRIVHPDGTVKAIKADAIVTRDAEGKAIRMIGLNRDITEHKTAEQEIRALNETLEDRVAERTIELEAVNRNLLQEITERMRIEETLKNYADQLRTFSSRLMNARESERRFIAHELHDEIGQSLTGLKLSLDKVRRLADHDTADKLQAVQKDIADLMGSVRNLSLNLRPSLLDDFGLLPTMQWHFKRFSEQTGVQVDFKHMGLDRRFPTEIETAIFRIVQEALTNVARHANVSAVSVTITALHHEVIVIIEDIGAGFDFTAVMKDRQTLGLTGMSERAEDVGGSLMVRSSPGSGTQLTITIPVPSL
jgi:PAS domain S-box-containing protein